MAEKHKSIRARGERMMSTVAAPRGAPLTLESLRSVGPRRGVLQIVPPRHVVKPTILSSAEQSDHELVTHPLSSPTGPHGAQGFRNRGGSQIPKPHVINIYLGPFWGDQAFLETFSKAVVENGYLDPLSELNYGTGSGTYAGSLKGPVITAAVFNDSDAHTVLSDMIDAGIITPDANTLFMMILPQGVASRFDSDGSMSCTSYCGYHDAFNHKGVDVAYAILPSSVGCDGCGNGVIGDFTAVYAHELAEACTDKIPGQGWVADDGEENGDLEAWILFGWGPSTDPKRFTVQGYYTNERGNTVGAWRLGTVGA